MMSSATESTASIRGSPLSVVGWLTRRVCPHGMEQVLREVSPWSWWPSDHRRHTRCVGEEGMLSGVTDVVWIGPAGRDIGVDVLATELVIDWRLTHRVTL
ncbi:MAG: hypothetical protein ACRDQ4_20030 [Pseudonocardiaceae bacterium]